MGLLAYLVPQWASYALAVRRSARPLTFEDLNVAIALGVKVTAGRHEVLPSIRKDCTEITSENRPTRPLKSRRFSKRPFLY
jgi:hypothetical protein